MSFRSIAYLNLDVAVTGLWSMTAGALPNLYKVIYDAAKITPLPNDRSKNIYDDWLKKLPNKNNSKPRFYRNRICVKCNPLILTESVAWALGVILPPLSK